MMVRYFIKIKPIKAKKTFISAKKINNIVINIIIIISMKHLTSIINFDYVPTQYEEKITSFKYSGVDKSLLYKYVFSPLANFCIKFTPETIA